MKKGWLQFVMVLVISFAAHSTVQVRGVQTVCGSLTNFSKSLKTLKAVTWIMLYVRLEEWMMLAQLGAAVELESWTQIVKDVSKTGTKQLGWQSRETYSFKYSLMCFWPIWVNCAVNCVGGDAPPHWVTVLYPLLPTLLPWFLQQILCSGMTSAGSECACRSASLQGLERGSEPPGEPAKL